MSDSPSPESQYRGAMLGAALGDAIGARKEGGLIGAALWAVLNIGYRETRWSDDTQMAMVLAEHLVEQGGVDDDALARSWAARAEFVRGYGPGMRKLLARIRKGTPWREANRSVFGAGSYGNGAAMRGHPIGLFYAEDPAQLEAMARLTSEITHAHPLGVGGGLLIAQATALSLEGLRGAALLEALAAGLATGCGEEEYGALLARALELLADPPTPRQLKKTLGNGVVAQRSAVTAIFLASHHQDYSAMIENAVALGGDTDTIAAMAGALFGARRGEEALPARWLELLEAREALAELGSQLYSHPARPRRAGSEELA